MTKKQSRSGILGKLIIIGFFTLFSSNILAQLSVKGLPESFALKTKNSVVIPSIECNALDTCSLLNEDKEKGILNRYGVVQSIEINITSSGVQDQTENGTIWRLQVNSLHAFSLGLRFKKFVIPPGAKVFIYNKTKDKVAGAFTYTNNTTEGLSIADFKGQCLIIEYYEPDSSAFPGVLILESVSQAYRDILGTSPSRIGINCPEGINWQNEKHAVCRMTYNDKRYSYYCTGFLVNNVRADGTPYFQTANHCINTNEEASTLVTYFNYENSTCISNDAFTNQTLSGATLVSTNTYTDFSLLLLKEYPPIEYNPYFAGWDATDRKPQTGTSIHHPAGTPKSISVDLNAPVNYPYSTQWTDENNNVTSTTTPNVHWMVEYESGATEPGSSGSPLFDDNHRVIGQLHGGGENSGDLFSKFSVSWDYSTDIAKQLKHWLDPENTGTKNVDGTYFRIKPKAEFSTSFTNVCTDSPVKFSDQSKYAPNKWEWKISPSAYRFVNGTNQNSPSPEIVFNSPGSYTISLNVLNNFGTDSLIKVNYLNVGNLDVSLNNFKKDSVICGCNLINFPIKVSGAENYSFKFEKNKKVNSNFRSDSIFLTLKEEVKKEGSFDSWLIVTGTQGNCKSSDSTLFKIIIPPNDNIQNAQTLNPGLNQVDSNLCGSVQKNEPYPSLVNCFSDMSWCPDNSKSDSILKNTLWFTFRGPSNGTITIDTKGLNSRIAVYEADSYSNILSGNKSLFNILAANDDRSPSDTTSLIENLKVEPYKTYWLQVDAKFGSVGEQTIELKSKSLEVFPNPTSGQVSIDLPNITEGDTEVTVIAVSGKIVYTEHVNISKEASRFLLDLSAQPSGLYFIRVTQVNFTVSAKLVITR